MLGSNFPRSPQFFPAREVREQPDGSLYVTVGRLSQHLKGKEEARTRQDALSVMEKSRLNHGETRENGW